jgi:hypothetical protein
LSSIVSVNMMSYLYVCAQNGIDIVLSSDQAEATLEVLENGSGRFFRSPFISKLLLYKSNYQITLPRSKQTLLYC